LLLLAVRNLRARVARTAFTATAIALGVAMIFAMRLVGATVTESARLARESRLAGADLEITSAASAQIPLTLLETLAARPEVEVAAPLYRGLEGKPGRDATFSMGGLTLEGTGLALLGVDPARTLTPYELAAGRFLQAGDSRAVLLPSDWAAPRGHSVGGQIRLTTGAQTHTYTIVGLLKPRREAAATTPTAWLPIAALSAAFDAPGAATAVQVRLAPGQNPETVRVSLQAALGDQYIVTSAAGSSSLNSLYSLVNLALPVSGFAVLLAGGFLVFNAFAITLAERKREIGQLRTLGMTRRQVLAQALLEAGLVGGLGSALGLLFGLGLGAGMVAVVRALNGDEGAAGAVIPWDAWLLAAGAGVLVTVAVTFGLARAAARVSPLEAFKPPLAGEAKRRSRRAWLVAVVIGLLAATAGLYAWGVEYARTALTPSYGPIFAPALTFSAAVAAALPLALDGLLALLERGRWLAGRLAAASLRRQGSRAPLTAAALTLSFMLVIALTGLALFMSEFLLSFNTSMFSGQVVLIRPFPPGTSLGASAALPSLPPIPPDVQADIDSLRAVAEINYFANVAIPGVGVESGAGDQYAFALPISAIRGKRTFPIAEGSWEEAERRFAENEPAILLPELTGRKLDKHPGDTLEIDTLKGRVAFTVAAVGGGFPVISPAAAAEYFGSHPFGILFTPKAGVERADLEARVGALRERHRTELGLFDTAQLTGVVDQLIGPIQALFGGLTSLSGLVAALGIVVTLFASVLERQREIGALRAVGLTRGEVRGLVVLEAGLLGFGGAALGALGGLGLAALFGQGMNTAMEAMTGASPLEGLPLPWPLALAALVIGPVIAMLAALWPAGRAAEVDPAVAMRAEGAAGFASPAAKRPAPPRRRLPRSLAWTLMWRSLAQQRTRATLSVLAVLLGAAMTVGGDVLAGAIIGVVTRTEDLRAIGEGLWSQLDPMFKGVGVGLTLAAGFLVFNTFAMSITQRRQQIGLLRALGMTRAQIVRLVLAEAVFIGGLGVLLGVALGPVFGQGVIALIRSLDNPILNAFAPGAPSAFSFALATAAGLGVTLLAALVPARQAMRVSPLTALRAAEAAGLEHASGRLGLGGAALLLAVPAYLLLAPPALWLSPPANVWATVGFGAAWLAGVALLMPALVGGIGATARPLLARLGGAAGRLMADNVRRGRGRVLLTVATLAVSLTMIGGLTGFITFFLYESFGPQLEALRREDSWVTSVIRIEEGLAAYTEMDSMRVPQAAIDEFSAAANGRAEVMPFKFVIVPELAFLGDAYFSFVLDPRQLRQADTLFIRFKEGGWETALPIMERGCGLLMTPAVAARNNVGLGDALTVTGADGPVACTVAGLGTTFVGATLISNVVEDRFDSGQPFSLFIQARPDADLPALEADLRGVAERHGLSFDTMRQYSDLILQAMDTVPTLFNAFLLLAVVAAALGVVNTTLLSVTERRREFGQLRALGATRRQVRAVVVGEAALMGLLAGGVGLLAAAGLTLVFTAVYGGSSVGATAYDPWSALGRTLPGVLAIGLVGLITSPLVCALAAYLPANAVLRGAALETLKPEQPAPLTARRVAGFLGRGSLQTRFVLGTAALLLAVLAVLVLAVVQHAGGYLRAQSRDMLAALADWNAATVEAALPPEADRLDFTALSGSAFPLDAPALLRFQSLLDSFSENGVAEYALTTADGVVLFGLDPDQVGETRPPPAERETVTVTEGADEAGAPLLAAVAPVKNRAGVVLGYVRVTLRFDTLRQFLGNLQRTLWLGGGLIVLAGLALGSALIRPLARAARGLAAQATRVQAGDYTPLEIRAGRVSMRTRLTILMTLLVAGLVGGLGLIVIPIERREVERTVQTSVLTSARWFGDTFSELAGQPMTATASLPDPLNLAGQMGQPGGGGPAGAAGLDFGRLQDIVARFRGDLIAYTAWVDRDGRIVFSDQLNLQGEPGVTASEARVADARWRGEAVWVAAAPLRRGRQGEQLGTLNIGLRRASVEAFLAESRTLFGLIGLSALLAGVLLAQALGAAVAAPVEQLAGGARRVAQGDLRARFQAGSGDELAQLAGAFNEMVAGLRERERLRDLFGRYVSREVGEAVLAGRVSLAGERKTITVLYVDMRGSTAFAESRPPEEVMAALNQYFEVVILAVEAHGGIVNRFVGDEAVCVFGAPTEHPDHAERAVQAALAIRQGLAYVNARRETLGQPTLRFGLGINTGEVVAGATGSEERQEYTVIGDAMNTGARIQALTKTYPEHDLLISEYTVAALGEAAARHALVDLGEAEIRGKSQPVRVYAVR